MFIWEFPSVVALGLGVWPSRTLRQSPEGAEGPLNQPEGQRPETPVCPAHHGALGARPGSETRLRPSLRAGGLQQ